MKKWILIAMALNFGFLSAQTVHEARDSVKIYFRQGKIDLVPSLKGNLSALDRRFTASPVSISRTRPLVKVKAPFTPPQPSVGGPKKARSTSMPG